MNLHLDLTLTDEQTEALQTVAAQRGLPVEALVQRALERFLSDELPHSPFAELLAFARGIDFDTADAKTIAHMIEARGFIFPLPTEVLLMHDADRDILLQLSAFLAEDEYRSNPELNFQIYDEILDYD